jgi:thioredoxin-like negative regulator of GroEL
MAHIIEKIASHRLGADEYDAAADLLAIVLRADPLNHRVRGLLVSALIELGQLDSATHHLASLPSPRPGEFQDVLTRAKWLVLADQPYEARSFVVAHFGEYPKNPVARLLLATIEAKLLRLEAAQLMLEAPDNRWTEEQQLRVNEIKRSISDR